MIVPCLFFASTPAEGVIWRITLSAPLSWMLTYVCVRSASRQGRFRVLHPNDALSQRKARAGVFEYDVSFSKTV